MSLKENVSKCFEMVPELKRRVAELEEKLSIQELRHVDNLDKMKVHITERDKRIAEIQNQKEFGIMVDGLFLNSCDADTYIKLLKQDMARQIQAAEQRGFEAARELGDDGVYYAANGTTNIEYKFKTYADYLASLEKEKDAK